MGGGFEVVVFRSRDILVFDFGIDIWVGLVVLGLRVGD